MFELGNYEILKVFFFKYVLIPGSIHIIKDFNDAQVIKPEEKFIAVK